MSDSWVIPYIDQPLAFWQEVAGRFGQAIREVYFSLPGGAVATGRGPQPERFLTAFLQSAPLAKAALVNPVILSRPLEEIAPTILHHLAHLHGEYGVESVTVANPALARAIKEALPGFRVTGSVLMGIATPAQAVMVRDHLDALTPDTRLLRDLPGLQRLRAAFPGELRLLVNEACLPGCPYRVQHFYEMAHHRRPRSLCESLLTDHPWLRLTGAWVLPRHLYHYSGLYDSLKLAGRVTLRNPARYLQVLGAYIRREDILPCDIGGGPASPLTPIDMPSALFEQILHCNKNCHACTVCREHYERETAIHRW